MLTWTKTLSVLSVAEAWKRVLFRTPPSLEALSRAPGIKDRWSGAFGWESRPSAGCITRSAPIAALSAAFWNLTPVSMISSRRLVLRRLRLSRRNHFSVNFYTHHDAVSSWMTRHSYKARPGTKPPYEWPTIRPERVWPLPTSPYLGSVVADTPVVCRQTVHLNRSEALMRQNLDVN